MGTYRVLSLDGGGVKGVLTAKLLERLQGKFSHLIEKVDLITGNSAGSYLALGLADGRTPGEIVDLLKHNAKNIFGEPNEVLYIEPKYSNDQLIKFVDRLFGEKRLVDLQKKVVIPSFLVDDKNKGHWRPILFHNFPGSDTGNALVKDVALASSAAPTYFPSYKKMIDGGVYANNPSILGTAFAVSEWGDPHTLDELSLLSLGTGFYPYNITQDTTKWGDFQWLGLPLIYKPTGHNPLEPIIDVLFDGVSSVDDTITQMLLGERHYRLNPTLPSIIQLDNYERIPDLIKVAETTNLKSVQSFIEKTFLKE